MSLWNTCILAHGVRGCDFELHHRTKSDILQIIISFCIYTCSFYLIISIQEQLKHKTHIYFSFGEPFNSTQTPYISGLFLYIIMWLNDTTQIHGIQSMLRLQSLHARENLLYQTIITFICAHEPVSLITFHKANEYKFLHGDSGSVATHPLNLIVKTSLTT
eukprot:469642_1